MKTITLSNTSYHHFVYKSNGLSQRYDWYDIISIIMILRKIFFYYDNIGRCLVYSLNTIYGKSQPQNMKYQTLHEESSNLHWFNTCKSERHGVTSRRYDMKYWLWYHIYYTNDHFFWILLGWYTLGLTPFSHYLKSSKCPQSSQSFVILWCPKKCLSIWRHGVTIDNYDHNS